jgi:thiol-disulfide isomerase/thioredoxin
MIRPISALVLCSAVAWSFSSTAKAQCATCGNPALSGAGSDLGDAFGEGAGDPVWSVSTSLNYSYSSFSNFIDGDNGNKPADPAYLRSLNIDEGYNLGLNLGVLSLDVGLPIKPGGLGMTLVLPYGAATVERPAGPQTDLSWADVELRFRSNVSRLLGMDRKSPNIGLSFGLVSPTGEFLTSGDTVQATDQYVSLGRGVYWGVLDSTVTTRVGDYSVFLNGNYRSPLNVYEAANQQYRYNWGDEARATVGATGQLIKGKLGGVLSAEYSWRGAGWEWQTASDEDGKEFKNTGGSGVALSAVLQGKLTDSLSGNAALRFTAANWVNGVQFAPSPSFSVGISHRWAQKRVKKAKPNLPKPSIAVGEKPKDPEIAKLLVPGKITVVDYWAEWCVNCMKLKPVIEERLAHFPDVVLTKVDATKWEVEEFVRFLPATPELPAVDIFGRDGRLIIRLGGEACFDYEKHIPKEALVGQTEYEEAAAAESAPVPTIDAATQPAAESAVESASP